MTSEENKMDFITGWIEQNEGGKSSKTKRLIFDLISKNRQGLKKEILDEKKFLQDMKEIIQTNKGG
jgi:hypothetical protein